MKAVFGWLLSFVLTLLVVWLAFAGWHAQACPEGVGDGMGWGLLALLVMPVQFPTVGLLLVLGLLLLPSVLARQASSAGGALRVSTLLLATGVVFFGLAWLAARLLDATARCSVGF